MHKVTISRLSRLSKRPPKVTERHRKCHGSIERKIPFHSNYGPILYRFPHIIARYGIGRKSRNLYAPRPHLIQRVTLSKFRKDV